VAKQRYVVALVRNSQEFSKANALLQGLVAGGTHVACLYVTTCDPKTFAHSRETLEWLRSHLLKDFSLPEDACETTLSQTLSVPCPVTGTTVAFPDFDIVAFYPHAINEVDPLYDPSVHAPFICLNQASDLYGFALYMREVMERAGGGDATNVLPQCAMQAMSQWNDMACKTINAFRKRTNPAVLHPAGVSEDGRHYLTPHNEAALHELEKKVYLSEMPRIYLTRLVGEWERQLTGQGSVRLGDVVRPAVCLSELGLQGLSSARRDPR